MPFGAGALFRCHGSVHTLWVGRSLLPLPEQYRMQRGPPSHSGCLSASLFLSLAPSPPPRLSLTLARSLSSVYLCCITSTCCWGQVVLLEQRLDGFVSVDAEFLFDNDTAKMPGFTTRAVTVPNVTSCVSPSMPGLTQLNAQLQLRLNVQTSVVGFVAVELLEPGAATAVAGFAHRDADIIVGNFLERPVTWRGGNATINALGGRSVQLRVLFAAAKIFSFQFVCV